MVNYACAFSQSEMEKCFEWIINKLIHVGFLQPFAPMTAINKKEPITGICFILKFPDHVGTLS